MRQPVLNHVSVLELLYIQGYTARYCDRLLRHTAEFTLGHIALDRKGTLHLTGWYRSKPATHKWRTRA